MEPKDPLGPVYNATDYFLIRNTNDTDWFSIYATPSYL